MPLIRKPPGAMPAGAGTDGDVFAELTGGTEDQRWHAARSVAALPNGVAALGAALAMETSVRVRTAMFTSLTREGSSASIRAILACLRSDDASVRTGALDALRAIPAALLPHMPDLLRDADADVRILSCEIARDLASGEAEPLLCDVLDRDTDPNVCAAAVDVLAEIGGKQTLPALRRCLVRFPHETFLGFAIRMAIQRLGGQTDGPA